VYLEAISYKLGLNFIYDLNSIGVVATSINMDFYWVNSAGYGFAPGVHTSKNFHTFESAKSNYNSTYPTYINSDKSGSTVGVQYVAGTLQIFDFQASIVIINVLGSYQINYTFPANIQLTPQIQSYIDFHRQSVVGLINTYKAEYEPFVTLYPTIYAFIYADPGYFNLTDMLEAKRRIIMNKRI
jgi:hypothetical protein